MEKKKNEITNENKETKHHHHHRHNHQRKLSLPKELSNNKLKIIDILKPDRSKDNDKNNKKKSVNLNINMHSSQRDSQKKDQKHHRHGHRNSSVASDREKNYFKYKLENFGKVKKVKEKRFALPDVDCNMPKNVDKYNEKYFKQKYKEKEKEKMKKIKTEVNILNEYNNKKQDKDAMKYSQINDNINPNNNKMNHYSNNNLQKYVDIPNKKNQIFSKIGGSSKIVNNYAQRDSMFNDLSNNKLKTKYLQNNEYMYKNEKNKNKNYILEGEINISQDKNNKSNNNIKNEDKDIDNNYNNKDNYINNEKKRNHDRKRSMKISSKYSDKMESQIADELEKMKKEKELEKRKNEDNHSDNMKQKESFAQEHFIKAYMSHLSPYIDYGGICSRLPGGYTFLQSKLIYLDLACPEEEFNYIYNKKNFYKSKNAKELCRKGIPLKYFKIFFKKLLNLENYKENYNMKYSMIIKDIDPKYLGDYVPYFCGQEKMKLKEVLPVHYLNEEGILNLKVIMWLIVDLVPKIEYCPLLVKICSILLIFLEKEEVYEAMRTLIEMNYRPTEIYKLRWHFRYSYFENKKLVESIKIFLENESDNMKNLFAFFLQKGLDPILLINDMCESLFLKYLNFYGLLRFICIFIYEGSKTLYRFIYGFLNYVYEEKLDVLKNTRNDLIHEIRQIICGITDYKKIIQDSFNLQVTRDNNGYVKNQFGEEIEELEKPFEENTVYIDTDNDINININEENTQHRENNYLNEFYLPTIEPTSNILSSKEIMRLWPKLPTNLKRSNLATIYSLSKKKVNMKSLIELSKKYPEDYPILILIETEQNELFGVILPRMLTETEEKEYIELNKCCLVNFRPKISLYKDNYSKGINMLCCNKKGLWFCKQEVGDLFYIDGTLSEGKTCKNNTYFGQVCLTRKDHFLVKDMEIIVFANSTF